MITNTRYIDPHEHDNKFYNEHGEYKNNFVTYIVNAKCSAKLLRSDTNMMNTENAHYGHEKHWAA